MYNICVTICYIVKKTRHNENLGITDAKFSLTQRNYGMHMSH